MAPTPTPVHDHSPNHQFGNGRHFRHLRRQGQNFSHYPPRLPSAPRTEQSKARTPDVAFQPLAAIESPLPPPIAPSPSESVALASQPTALPVGNNQPSGPNQPVDISGNIAAATIVVILILGGLIGLVVGGEILRRRARTTGGKTSPPSRCLGRRKSEAIRNAAGPPQKRTKMDRGKSPHYEKTPTPLARPPRVLNRERQQRLPNVWPIRSLSRALCNPRPCPERVERSLQHSSPVTSPQTTWSEFSPVSLYVPPPRTVLACIPEELEDYQNQTDIDVSAVLGIPLQRSLESCSVVFTPQASQRKASRDMLLEGSRLSATTEQRSLQDCQIICKARTRDEDTKSLGSSAPDMTSDGESGRSSMVSLESFGDGNDRESLREEVFELRRAQTRSMQLNKGVLLSLSLKTLDDSPTPESVHGPSRSPSAQDVEGGKDHAERDLSLAMLGANFSAISLDEFPSPPSILPMIPSFVSGF